MDLQSEFITFHENIKLDDENETLRDKRDILLKKLKENISDKAASYTTFNQGSYAMGTGIFPESGDYDIDVGLRFDVNKDDYKDPVTLKKWVKDALDGHTKSVEIRRSCVTVTYQIDGDDLYHVDFAIYANSCPDGKMYLAKGKEFSGEENRIWEPSDPLGLIDKIKAKFDGDDAKQFRRVIRYMKKWKSRKFSCDGNEAPTGISLTVLAYNHFLPTKTYDWSKEKNSYDDLSALRSLLSSIKDQFVEKWNAADGRYYRTISLSLPVDPYCNLFSKMTDKQMDNFYQTIVIALGKLL